MTVSSTKVSRTLWVLLGGVLLIHVADYLFIPILPVVLRDERGLTAGQVGLVLGVNSLLFLSGSLLGGTLSDRMGRRTIMVVGASLRVLGLIGLGSLSGATYLIFSAAVNGLGTGFYAPSLKAAIAAIASGETKTTAFSWRGIAANIGTGSAGFIVLVLAGAPSPFLFYIAAGIQLGIAIFTWTLVPRECDAAVGEEDCPRLQAGALGSVLQNRAFLAFGAATFFMWALYAQLALALPLRASAVLPNAKTVGLIWSINSLIVITMQNLITRSVIKRLHPMTAISAGALFLGAGITAIGFAGSFPTLAVAAAVFVIGEMLILPTVDSTVSQLAGAGQVGIFFGLANFVSGTGESVGSFLGGQLLERTQGVVSPTPWLVYGGFALAVTSIVMAVRYWAPLRSALRAAAADPSGPQSAPRVGIMGEVRKEEERSTEDLTRV